MREPPQVRSSLRRASRAGLPCGLWPAACVALVLGVSAQDGSAQDWLSFRSTLGYESLTSGDLAQVLDGGIRSDWSVVFSQGPLPSWVWLGVGISRVTYRQDPAYPATTTVPIQSTHDEEWNHVRWHVAVGADVVTKPWFTLYVERRRIWGRLRSQSHLTRPPTDDPPHTTPYDEWGVGGWDFSIGFRSDLNGLLPVRIDATYRQGDVMPRGATHFDLVEYGLGVRQGASVRGFQLGVRWDV